MAGGSTAKPRRQVGSALGDGLSQLKDNGGDIVSIVLGGISTIGSVLVTLVLILVLVFFYLKDGPRLLPWLQKQTASRAGPHIAELSARYYASLSSFMITQAFVGLLDAVLIGVGLLIVGVPLVLPLTMLTFIGAFVSIIGAFVAGGVAVQRGDDPGGGDRGDSGRARGQSDPHRHEPAEQDRREVGSAREFADDISDKPAGEAVDGVQQGNWAMMPSVAAPRMSAMNG